MVWREWFGIQIYLPHDAVSLAQIGVGLAVLALGLYQIVRDWLRRRRRSRHD